MKVNVRSIGILVTLFFAHFAIAQEEVPALPTSNSDEVTFDRFPVLDIVNSAIKSKPMTFNDLKFISDRLYLDKMADNLDCEVKVEEIKQEKRFSTGTKIVEMLKISFRNDRYRPDAHVAFFPVGSSLTIQTKNSPYAGAVEEFKIESDDLYNSQFIFQHDGSGRIIWMNYVSDLLTLPCSFK
jgi:hypothetical protein